MEDLSERKLTQIILSEVPSARSLETTEFILARNRFRKRRVLEVLRHLHMQDMKDIRGGNLTTAHCKKVLAVMERIPE